MLFRHYAFTIKCIYIHIFYLKNYNNNAIIFKIALRPNRDF